MSIYTRICSTHYMNNSLLPTEDYFMRVKSIMDLIIDAVNELFKTLNGLCNNYCIIIETLLHYFHPYFRHSHRGVIVYGHSHRGVIVYGHRP